jgi:hypothetical protein
MPLKASSPRGGAESPSIATLGASGDIVNDKMAGDSQAPQSPSPAQLESRRVRELQLRGDSDKVRAVALMVAESLGRNPRRLKQFMNLFRLQAYIANEIGLFDPGNGGPPLTLEQVGKFVAISLRWPALLADFADEPELFTRLEASTTGDPRTRSSIETRWLNEPRLRKILNSGLEYQAQRYTLSNPRIYQLLYICPQRVSPRTKAQQPI